MIRLFEEHQVRKTTELSSSLWDFSQVTDGKNTPVGKVTVPSCWESYPGFEAYRGQGLYERSFEADGDVRIVFKGVSHTAKVFVDGNQVAEHYNAFTQFEAGETAASAKYAFAQIRHSTNSAAHATRY